MPHLKEDKAMYSDPVATDLVGALLAVRILPLFVSYEKNNKLATSIYHAYICSRFFFPSIFFIIV